MTLSANVASESKSKISCARKGSDIGWRPRVATVVLHYKNLEDTVRCVRSIRRSTVLDQRIVVVDNGPSGPDHDQLVDAVGPGVRTIASGDNLGYAAGNNLGMRLALADRPEFVWLLNPDARVEPSTLAGLLAGAEEVPDAGVIGCRIVYDGEPARIWFDGGIVDRSRAGAPSHVNMGLPESKAGPSVTREVDYVTGACMLLRRRMLGRVGLLPEDYFLYFEETEFCLRARAAGWRIVLAGRARMRHLKRSSGALPTPYYLYYMTRNRMLFARRVLGADPERALGDLQEVFLSPWRSRVEAQAPSWLPEFDRLVDLAIGDGRAGVTGRRREIEDMVGPGEAQEAVR
jgi:GT2 family glycosyltransferase